MWLRMPRIYVADACFFVPFAVNEDGGGGWTTHDLERNASFRGLWISSILRSPYVAPIRSSLCIYILNPKVMGHRHMKHEPDLDGWSVMARLRSLGRTSGRYCE